MDKKALIPFIVGALILCAGSFYGGMTYGQTLAKPGSGQGLAQGSGGGPGGRGAGQGRAGAAVRGGAGFTNGQVISKDANTLTVKMRDGSSKIVIFSTSTRIAHTTDGTMNDISKDTDVMITGTPNSDGSITAAMIQIRPPGLPGGPGFGGGDGASSTRRDPPPTQP